MTAKDRRRDRKRRKKLEKDKRRARPSRSLAYHGKKFKTKELIMTLMDAEIGIYETYVMTDKQLLDRTVVSALEKLIGTMRKGGLPELPETDTIHYTVGNEEDLLIENILRSWADRPAEVKPTRAQLIGVLRTILGSVENVSSAGPSSRSYLQFMAGFLTKKLGVKVEQFDELGKPLTEEGEDDIVRIGREWAENGNQDAKAEFFEITTDLIKIGQADRVIDACDLLVGEISDVSSEVANELMMLNFTAQRSQLAAIR